MPRPMRPISTVGSPLVSFVHFVPPSIDLYSPLSGPPPPPKRRAGRGAPLIRRHIDRVGLLRIHHHVGDAGVGADREHGLPVLAAVGCLVEAAVAGGRPPRAARREADARRE